MEGPADPFREGIPDFEDERLNAMAELVAGRGIETHTLTGMGTYEDVFRAVSTLEDFEAMATLIVMTAWYRQLSGEALTWGDG